jgi:hypothetical protein
VSTTFRSLALTSAVAVATLAAIDWVLQGLRPLEHKREVADGIAQLQRTDPETLVIGSSHARTFHVLGQQLAADTGRPTPLVAIPLENGKLLPYDWLVDNRVRAIIDRSGPDGRPAYGNLRRFVLLTEWWDSCVLPDGVHWNLPSRAWGVEHYMADVAAHGMTSYNRNYSQYQFRQMFRFSTLVHDRTDPTIKDTLVRVAKGIPLVRTKAEYESTMDSWRRNIERGVDCIGDPGQMAAFGRLLDFAVARGLETIVVLFPRMPGTLTPKAKETTLARFRELVERKAAPRGVRVVDLTWKTPLEDGDFMADFDHVSAAGNLKFARWALGSDLPFLLGPMGDTRASSLPVGLAR